MDLCRKKGSFLTAHRQSGRFVTPSGHHGLAKASSVGRSQCSRRDAKDGFSRSRGRGGRRLSFVNYCRHCRGARVTRCGPTERAGFPVIMVSSASLRPLNESPIAPRRFSQRVLLAYCFKGHCLWALSKVLDSVDYHLPEPYAITP